MKKLFSLTLCSLLYSQIAFTSSENIPLSPRSRDRVRDFVLSKHPDVSATFHEMRKQKNHAKEEVILCERNIGKKLEEYDRMIRQLGLEQEERSYPDQFKHTASITRSTNGNTATIYAEVSEAEMRNLLGQ